MIGATPTHGSDFRGLQAYLFHGRSKEAEHRVLWWAGRNLYTDEPEGNAKEMEAVASQNPRVEKPVYHFSINAAPGEELDQEQWEKVADRVLAELGLSGHQAMIVAHGDTGHRHIHLAVNRVHPVTHRAWKTYRDWPKIEAALRRLEREMGLREVPGHHFQLEGQERPDRSESVTSGEWHERQRTGEEPWALRMRFRLYRHFRDADSWADLERRLAKEGVHLKARGRGLVVTDGERMVKASRIRREGSRGALEERFGLEYSTWRREITTLHRAIDRYRDLEHEEQRLIGRQHEILADSRDQARLLAPIKKLQDEIAEHQRALSRSLAVVYGRQAPAAAERLERTVVEQGYAAAAELVRNRPSQLARLAGLTPLDAERKRALDSSRQAAGIVLEIGKKTHELHRLAEQVAVRGLKGPSPQMLRRVLDAAYRHTLPRLEALYGSQEAPRALEKLRELGVSEAVETLHEAPSRLAPVASQEPGPVAAELAHLLEALRPLRREMARAIEREKHLRLTEGLLPQADSSEPDSVAAARRQLDAAYQELEARLAPAYAQGPLRRSLDSVPPRHLMRRLATWPEPKHGTVAAEVRAAALEHGRAALEEVAGRSRDLARELGRRSRKRGQVKNPSPTTRARWRLDDAVSELERELRPLWGREHQDEAIRRLTRLPGRRAREILETDPGYFGPLAQPETARKRVEAARRQLGQVELSQDNLHTHLRRAGRQMWEKEREADPATPGPDPVTAARWRLDRAYEALEPELGRLWKPGARQEALLRVRHLEPSRAARALAADPGQFGTLAVEKAKAAEILRGRRGEFERLGELRRQMLGALDRERRHQFEHDRAAGRPAAAPDPLTDARWRLDRAYVVTAV